MRHAGLPPINTVMHAAPNRVEPCVVASLSLAAGLPMCPPHAAAENTCDDRGAPALAGSRAPKGRLPGESRFRGRRPAKAGALRSVHDSGAKPRRHQLIFTKLPLMV